MFLAPSASAASVDGDGGLRLPPGSDNNRGGVAVAAAGQAAPQILRNKRWSTTFAGGATNNKNSSGERISVSIARIDAEADLKDI